MPCHSCGATGLRTDVRCPECGAPHGVEGGIERDRSASTDRPLATDGGQPPEDDPEAEADATGGSDGAPDADASEGQPGAGQPTGGQSGGGQPTGGQPAGGQPTGGQPTGGQPGAGQPQGGQPTGGQPGGGRPQGGQPQGGQPRGNQPPAGGPQGGAPGAAGQPGAGQPPAGQPGAGQPVGGQPAGAGGGAPAGAAAGGYHHQSGSDQLVLLLKSLPWGRGAVAGVLSLLIPYVLVMAASLTLLQQRAATIGTNIFFGLVGFGQGEMIRDAFVSGSTISSLGNVRPQDYPDVSAELDRALDLLGTSSFGFGGPTSNPEALLLALYVIFPLILVLGGRYLARNHAREEDLYQHLALPLTLVAGTLPVTLVLTGAFTVVNPGGRIVMAGLLLPLLFGLAGTMTVYGFGRYSWFPSKAYGWAAGVGGLLVTVLLYPLPTAGLSIDIVQQFMLGLHGFISTLSFGSGLSVPGAAGAPGGAGAVTGFAFGGGARGLLIVFVVFGLIALAGFARVYRSERHFPRPLHGARMGASIVLGVLPLVALLGILLPILYVVVGGSFGISTVLAMTMPNVSSFTALLLVGGTVVPLVLGSLGGSLAVWYAQRQQYGQPQAAPRQPRR